ncbi:hypothetical protein IBT49_10730 [Erwinia sp. S63]|uniref:hypothetical protein n=1 Tax=Erwinia sp. S63 TaxID=2769341 RepID=UPI00190D2A28|nr:hypothetical protein [Erwinia sp. S63]MBK0096450.1 hypothetical protein [Erwinia sp. S63]
MRIPVSHLVFGALFLIFGYLSYNETISFYLSNFAGTVADIRSVLIAPLFTALFYLLYYIASSFTFRKLSRPTTSKEVVFQTLFFIANVLLLLLSAKLFSWKTSNELSGATQLIDLDTQKIVLTYLVASLAAFIIFIAIRKKWR